MRAMRSQGRRGYASILLAFDRAHGHDARWTKWLKRVGDRTWRSNVRVSTGLSARQSLASDAVACFQQHDERLTHGFDIEPDAWQRRRVLARLANRHADRVLAEVLRVSNELLHVLGPFVDRPSRCWAPRDNFEPTPCPNFHV